MSRWMPRVYGKLAGIAQIAGVVEIDVSGRDERRPARRRDPRPGPRPRARLPTSTTILPTCWFCFIIWCGAGHSDEREHLGQHRLDLALGDQPVGALALIGVGEVAADDRLLAHPQVAHVEVELEPGRGAADHDLAEGLAHEHAGGEGGRADVLEHDVAVDAAGQPRGRALPKRLISSKLRSPVSGSASANSRRSMIAVAPSSRTRSILSSDETHRDRVGAVAARTAAPRMCPGRRRRPRRARCRRPAMRAPVDQHPVGGEVGEPVGGGLLPGQPRRLVQELLGLHLAVLGEAAPVRLVRPDLLLRAGHRVEAVALGALAAALVAVDHDLVAGLPAGHARARPVRRCPRRPSRRCGSRSRCSGRSTRAGPATPTRRCSSRRRPSPAPAPRRDRARASRSARAASPARDRPAGPAGSPTLPSSRPPESSAPDLPPRRPQARAAVAPPAQLGHARRPAARRRRRCPPVRAAVAGRRRRGGAARRRTPTRARAASPCSRPRSGCRRSG